MPKQQTYLEQYKSYSGNNPELEKIARLCDRLNLSPEQLIEKKIFPLNEEILEHNNELIAAITREYGGGMFCSGIPEILFIQTKLNLGVITEDSKLVSDFCSHSFLTGLNKSYSIELPSGREDFFDRKGSFFAGNSFLPNLFLFMRKPPVYSPDLNFHNASVLEDFEKKPRLELLIGNDKAVPILQEVLAGWQYDLASFLLGIGFPKNEDVKNKIKEEQLSLYKKIIFAERNVQRLVKSKEDKLNFSRETGGEGTIAYSGYLELIGDEVSVNLHHNPGITYAKRELSCLITTAKKRRYDEKGIKFEVKVDAGIIHDLNLKEFFADRINKYKKLT